MVIGEVNIMLEKEKSVVIDGETYHKKTREIVRVNLINDFKNHLQNNDTYFDWSCWQIDDFNVFNIPTFSLFAPNSFQFYHFNYETNYSENFIINSIMNIADKLKISGVSFDNGKRSNSYYSKRLEYDLFEDNLINTNIRGYGFNNCITADVKIENIFDYNYGEIINRCDYKEELLKMFKLKVDKLETQYQRNKLLIEFLEKKSNYKQRNP